MFAYPRSNEEAVMDFFQFLVSPLMLPITMGTAVYDYMEGTSHLDRKETIRNTLLWSGIAGFSWGYHAYMFPGQYSYLSPAGAYKTVGYLGGMPMAAAAVATASAVAWAATGDVHGAVPPGTGMGMPMTPDLYSGGTSSNPAGWDTSTWLANLFK